LTLAWSAATDNVGVTGYRVYRDGALVASPTSTSVAITELSASTLYAFTVAALNAAGNASAQSAPVSATTPAPAATPAPGDLGLYFKFDEASGTAAADVSGNNNTGALLGGAAFAAGRVNNALSLDGIDGRVLVANTTGLNLSSDLHPSALLYRADLVGRRLPVAIRGLRRFRGQAKNVHAGALAFVKVA